MIDTKAVIAQVTDRYYVLRRPGMDNMGGTSKSRLAEYARKAGYIVTFTDERKAELKAEVFDPHSGRKP